MMVTFVSQCEKKALKKTRRVLDAFADRIGDNTWQTVITAEGLLAVKRLLRKTASKNTAVSCHWIRSRSRSELIWVVGNKLKFDRVGKVPVNSTTINIPYRDDLADWHYLPLIQGLACLSALFHDWGKANARFQDKLSKIYKGHVGDALRHEWISCLLLKKLINSTHNLDSDNDWLSLLAEGKIDEKALLNIDLYSVKLPLKDLPPIAQMIAWLIVTHHRMPLLRNKQEIENRWIAVEAGNMKLLLSYIDQEWGYWNEPAAETLKDCLRFPKGLMSDSGQWLKAMRRWSRKLIEQQEVVDSLLTASNQLYRPILHHARLCLMLGDHYYSSLSKEKSGVWQNNIGMIANTRKDGSAKQALDQHLVGVYEQAKRNVRYLPKLERDLPVMENTTVLNRKSHIAKFKWQDTAARKIRYWTEQNNDTKYGFFAVNMASTGCGKTFANAKVMLAFTEDNASLRFILALGLRTLTLQTGDEYRDRIFQNSDGDDLAVLIGSEAITDLHGNSSTEKKDTIIEKGSESKEKFLGDNREIFYDVDIPEDEFSTIFPNEKSRKLLYAPILVCTIDHIMAATETTRGGRYILPALRLMSSDLVIDEVDDFTGADAIAIGRLIHLAGMLGRKVMISSATIPPSLAEGYFNCYRDGWQLFVGTRNACPTIGCAWIDEFATVIRDVEAVDQNVARLDYAKAHKTFIKKRVVKLSQQPVRRKSDIISCEEAMVSESLNQEGKQSAWFKIIIKAALAKHYEHHQVDQKTGIKASFGVIRTANILPCIALTRFLLEYDCPKKIELRVMPYHSQQVLLLRHEQEKHLDTVLKRKESAGEQPTAFHNDIIRTHLDFLAQKKPATENVLFILVATPVEEVGRDHDFDWAIVEPSSYRSIVQLAGRVMRHRDKEVQEPNVGLLQYNWKAVRSGDKPNACYFFRPGYEFNGKIVFNNKELRASCNTYNLDELVNTSSIAERLDAIPRIDDDLKLGSRLATLEHAVTAHWLKNYDAKGPESLQGYISQHWYMTALPQALNRFRQSRVSIHLFRCIDAEGRGFFTCKDEQANPVYYDNTNELVNQDDHYNIITVNLSSQEQKRVWLFREYKQLLTKKLDEYEINLNYAALRYGEVVIPEPYRQEQSDYIYNDQLGLFRQERE